MVSHLRCPLCGACSWEAPIVIMVRVPTDVNGNVLFSRIPSLKFKDLVREFSTSCDMEDSVSCKNCLREASRCYVCKKPANKSLNGVTFCSRKCARDLWENADEQIKELGWKTED